MTLAAQRPSYALVPGWGKLPDGSLIVYVGGDMGSQSLTLATHFPHLRFVVQDRESAIADAVEVRGSNPPLQASTIQ